MKEICQRLRSDGFPASRTRILVLCAILFLTRVPLGFCQELVFQNASLVAGVAGQRDAVDLFPDVTSTIDAHVKVTQRSANNVILNTGVMVTRKFAAREKTKSRTGARFESLATSSAAIRYVAGTFLRIKLLSFTAKGLNTDKVVLNWMTAQEKHSSHFTIEKSLDGKDFSDAGIVFSIGSSEQPKQYSFTDKLRAEERGIIYYRLKMVDVEGKSTHSSIRIVRIAERQSRCVNSRLSKPVASALRVTLPADRHDKKVTIDIFRPNEVLAKRSITSSASQNETVAARTLARGS